MAGLGATLVAVVVSARLLGGGYRSDVETICWAQERSRASLLDDSAEVSRWTREHLATPDGNRLLASLRDQPFAERGGRLRREAAAQDVAPCPAADAYEGVASEADRRWDLQQLCSSFVFPDFDAMDDDERLAALLSWIDDAAKSTGTRTLVETLRQAPPPDRGRVLRSAAAQAGVVSCELARVLDAPRPSAFDGGVDAGSRD